MAANVQPDQACGPDRSAEDLGEVEGFDVGEARADVREDGFEVGGAERGSGIFGGGGINGGRVVEGGVEGFADAGHGWVGGRGVGRMSHGLGSVGYGCGWVGRTT